jgi:two-component system, cell cycle response regulator
MAQILLVDDEKVARVLYNDFLTGAGHQVTALPNAKAAREALGRTQFDLVVTDLILPEGDGMQLLEHIKSSQPDVPVLVITALDKVEPAVRAIKSGAADYLVKPMTPEGLAHAVNRALTERLLLKENEALRRHVALLEAGQRISATLDRPAMLEAAGHAFVSLCDAKAVGLFVRDGHSLALVHLSGFSASADRAAALSAEVSEAVARVERTGQAVHLEGSPLPATFLVPVLEADAILGAVLLGFDSDLPAPGAQDASYLTRHLGLALRNLGKFAQVEDLVYLDDLTHLFNSRYLELVLDKEFKSSLKTERPFSLLFLDLDYFKSINDTHGHVVGSKLLVEVARVLKNCVRDNDVVCRWGGDEYVTLLRGTDSGGALKVAERIRRSVENHKFLAREGYAINVTTCIGVASYPEHALEKDTLIDFADRAMYRGKKGTRNIIYTASKNLEAPPASRRETAPLPKPP